MVRYFELKKKIVQRDIDRFKTKDPAKANEAQILARQLRDTRNEIDCDLGAYPAGETSGQRDQAAASGRMQAKDGSFSRYGTNRRRL